MEIVYTFCDYCKSSMDDGLEGCDHEKAVDEYGWVEIDGKIMCTECQERNPYK